MLDSRRTRHQLAPGVPIYKEGELQQAETWRNADAGLLQRIEVQAIGVSQVAAESNFRW